MNAISLTAAMSSYTKTLDFYQVFYKAFSSWLVKNEIGSANVSFLVVYGQKVEMSMTPIYVERLLGKVDFQLLIPTEIADQMARVHLMSVYLTHDQNYGLAGADVSHIDYIYAADKSEIETYIYKPIIQAFFQHYKVETR